MSATSKKPPRMRDARGRFIARPMFRIGEYRIGVDAPVIKVVAAKPRARRNALFAWLVTVIVAMFSLQSLARSWGSPNHDPL